MPINSMWQRVDSAPRDGTRVLLIASCPPLMQKFYTIGYFQDGHGWIADNPFSTIGMTIVQPTLWMQLPDMPPD